MLLKQPRDFELLSEEEKFEISYGERLKTLIPSPIDHPPQDLSNPKIILPGQKVDLDFRREGRDYYFSLSFPSGYEEEDRKSVV